MKGPSMLNAAIPLLMVAIITSNIAQNEALTPEETCPLVKNNTYIADPNNCKGWVLCRNGKATYGTCNDDFLYDSTSGVCDYPDNVQCNVDVKTMCAGLTDIYKADPNNCQNYCYCNEGTTYCEKCPAGQHFNPTKIECVWAEASTCVANSPCLLAQNGFIKDDKSCDGWVRCGSGQVISSGQCKEGLYYNPDNGLCDYPENVKCSTNPVGPTVPNEPVPADDLCKKDTYFYTDLKTCRGYFYCEKSGDKAQWGQCPKGSQFDQTLQQCIDPEKTVCEHDRCDGSSKAFMAVASTKCNEYYNCKNGASTGTKGKCPKGYPYFNELAGVCQAVALDYKVCAA